MKNNVVVKMNTAGYKKPDTKKILKTTMTIEVEGSINGVKSPIFRATLAKSSDGKTLVVEAININSEPIVKIHPL